MIAENKQEFFEQLDRELQKLGVEDRAELMSDLEEHFDEAERRGESESDVCRELGNIAEIARSCLDLKSTAINSMVARDVERKKGVSLTKPGRSVPADPTLAAPQNSGGASAEANTAEDCVRSYTPEHISEEIIPGAAQGGAGGVSGEAASGANGGVSGENANAAGGFSSENSGGFSGNTVSGSAEPQGDPNAANGSNSANGGTFEKIGKTVDNVCEKAGKALNEALNKAGNAAQSFRPSDSYRKNINDRKNGGDIPPQTEKVKTNGGGKFIDVSGLKPNVNGGRLGVEIVLDILLWGWLIITLFAVALAVFVGAAATAGTGIACVIGLGEFVQFRLPTRVLFMAGFFALAGAVFSLASLAGKGASALTKHVIERHIKAVYDI